jgi:sugar phosphate isomerase/epimerase
LVLGNRRLDGPHRSGPFVKIFVLRLTTVRFAICNELFEGEPLEHCLNLARHIGYTGLEVAPFTLGASADQISESVRRRFVEQVRQADLEIIGLHWLLAKTEGYHLTTDDSEIRARTASYLRELVRLCRDLGGGLMVLGSPQQRNFTPPTTHAQAAERAAEVLRDVVPELERQQVTLAIEPLGPEEGNFLNYADQAEELISSVGSSWVGLHLDVKAMSTERAPIPEVIRQHNTQLKHFHANDPNRLGPGMGDVPFAPIFAALNHIGYDGWVSVEVFDYRPGVEAIMQQSWDNMQAARVAAN